MKVIQVFYRDVYGRQTIYPANDVALTLAQIAGTKTLSLTTISLALRLGLVVDVVQEKTGLASQVAALQNNAQVAA